MITNFIPSACAKPQPSRCPAAAQAPSISTDISYFDTEPDRAHTCVFTFFLATMTQAKKVTKLLPFYTSIAISLGGCSLPPVKLSTPEPVKVDIKMRVDVYQYAASGTSKAKASSSEDSTNSATKPLFSPNDAARSERRVNIQGYKNAEYIGESHDGLLTILKEPDGDLGDRVRKAVEAENADRSAAMQATSRTQKIPLSEVQTQQGEANRIRAFKGEWIEQPQPDGKYIWLQKKT